MTGIKNAVETLRIRQEAGLNSCHSVKFLNVPNDR
jgi:hypothetical protein